MITSIDLEKVSYKTQYSFMIKNSQQTRKRRDPTQSVKEHT